MHKSVDLFNHQNSVKTLREDNQVSEDFKKEMAIMKRLRHNHLLSLIGVCSLEKPYYLVTEYMSEGCLLDFIRNVNPLHVNHLVQLQLVIQGIVPNLLKIDRVVL